MGYLFSQRLLDLIISLYKPISSDKIRCYILYTNTWTMMSLHFFTRSRLKETTSSYILCHNFKETIVLFILCFHPIWNEKNNCVVFVEYSHITSQIIIYIFTRNNGNGSMSSFDCIYSIVRKDAKKPPSWNYFDLPTSSNM